MQLVGNLIDEIRRQSAKLAEFKELYFIQQQERELAGQEYNELQDEMDANEQVAVLVLYAALICQFSVSLH